MQGFADKNEATKTKERVRKLVAAIISKKENTTAPTVPLATNSDPDDLSPWNIFYKMVASSTGQGTPLSRAIKEVDMYLSD